MGVVLLFIIFSYNVISSMKRMLIWVEQLTTIIED